MERLDETQYPNSLIRIIKFYRIFGFSFIETYDGINKSLFYYFKKYLMIFYNLLVVMFYIVIQLSAFPKMNQSLNIFKSKPVMNAVFFISSGIILVDFTQGYILSLIRGSKLLNLMKNKDIYNDDRNTKFANKIIAFNTLNMSITGSLNIYFCATYSLEQTTDSKVGRVSLILSIIPINFIYFGGVFMQPFIYAYIIQVIATQINNLNTYFKTGIELEIHSSFVNIFSLFSFRWDEKWSFVSTKM